MAIVRSRLCNIVASILALAPIAARGEEPPQDPRSVYFAVTLVEVPLAALKKGGIDLEELTKLPPPKDGSPELPDMPMPARAGKAHVDAETLPAVVQSLLREPDVRVLASARISTISGHKASLQLGDAIDLAGTPVALKDQSIKLEYSIRYSEPLPQTDTEKRHGIPGGKRQFHSGMGINLEAGKTTALAFRPLTRTNARGETEVFALVTLLSADYKPLQEIRTAEAAPMRPVRLPPGDDPTQR